jgi:hypothetical protein
VFTQAKVEYMILVLDEPGSLLVSDLFTYLELSLLRINIVHKLNDPNREKRKRNYDAIYLIEACDNSIDLLCIDFAESHKYLGAYVLTLNSLNEQHISKIKQQRNLLNRLQTLEEIDLHFRPCLTDGFMLDMPHYFNNRHSYKWT